MSTPEPDDSYPSQWRPSYIKERDEQRTEMELTVSAMSDAEFEAFTKRARGGN